MSSERDAPPSGDETTDWVGVVSAAPADVILQVDGTGCIEFVSGDVRELLRTDPADLPGRSLFDLVAPGDVERVARLLDRVRGGVTLEHEPVSLQLPTGPESVQMRARPLLDASKQVTGFVVGWRDPGPGTASLRAFASLLEGNRVLLRAKTEDELFQQMCDAIVDNGDYVFAWYGLRVDDAAHSVRPVAVSGDDRGYVDSIKVSWGEDEYGNGPTGLAIRNGITQVRNDLDDDPRYAPWLDATSARGVHCSISLPVVRDGVVHGALMVYARTPGAFDARAQEILENLAAEIGHGLARIAAEQRLRAALDSLVDPYFLLRPLRDEEERVFDFELVDANDVARRIAVEDGLELRAVRLRDALLPDVAEALITELRRITDLGQPVVIDDFAFEGGTAGRYADVRAGAVGDLVSLTWRDVTERHQSAAALRAAEERYRLIAENASDIVFMVGPDLVVSWISPSIEATTGWRREDVVGHVVAREFLHPDDSAETMRILRDAWTDDTILTSSARFRCADGSYRWMSVVGRALLGPAGEVMGRVVSMRDVHAQRLAEQDLEQREEQFRLLAQNASDVVISVGESGVIDWASPSSRAMLGYRPAELVGNTAALLLHEADVPLVSEAAAMARLGRQSTWRVPMVRKDGSTVWTETTIRPVRDERGRVVGRIAAVRDIHTEVRTQEALDQELAFDALTGTAKKPLAVERIQEILDTRVDPGWPLLCIGVYGMTAINQAFTYQGGDEVLRTVAERLVGAAGAHDRVARIAGDEFAVLLRDLVTPNEAAAAAERLIEAVQGPLRLPDGDVELRVSVGIALASDRDAEALLRNATAAMRQASRSGGGHWSFLEEDVSERSRHLLDTQKRLRSSMEDDSLVAWYMPVVSLTSGELVGYEALVRWTLPDGSVVAPDQFLMAAENSDLIIGIDRLQVRNAVRALVNLPADLHVSVNIAAFTLEYTDVVSHVVEELEAAGADPARLHFEVTETGLLRASKEVVEPMRRLGDLGCQWWVDDFGTGYSSISHLRDLPIQGLKLDRAFTTGTTVKDSPANRITQGLAGLANGLGLRTIAEGVETVDQAEVLRDQGWELGQGYLYGVARPL